MTPSPPAQHMRRNFALLLADYVLFSASMGFFSGSTVLPEFLGRLTESSSLIGLMSTIQMGAWTLPQLLAAGYVTGKPRKLPYLIWGAAIGRPAVLLLALVTWALGGRQPALVLLAAYLCLGAFMLTDAFAAVPWFDLVGKMVPANRRGRLFGGGQVAGGLAAIGVAGVVRAILSPGGPPFPDNYALLFLLGGIGLLLSLGTYFFLREEPAGDAGPAASWRGLLPRVTALLRHDPSFRRLTTVRLTAGLGALAAPFYVLLATGPLAISAQALGLFITAQTIGGIAAGLGLNYLNETRGSRAVIRLAIAITLLIPSSALLFLALSARGLAVPALWYASLFLLLGAANNSTMPGFFAYLLELAPDAERPTYLALSNTLNGAMLAAPLLGGWLLDRTSYGVLFVLTAACLMVSLLLSTGLTEPRHTATGAP